MAKAKGGLGKGFGALLGESLMAAEEESGGVSTLPMTLVEPNREQPRKRFSPETMQELTRSIEMHGVVTPITVRKTENGYYQIIAGERRWRAARSAGLTEIPALVIEADDKTVMELALIENLQREDLNPIEEAQGYHSLMEEYGLTQEQVAERVGRSRPAVANALRLLSLPDEAQELLADGTLSAGHARAVLAIKDEALRTHDVLEKMAGMSVRQAEKYAKSLQKEPEPQSEPDQPAEFQPDYTAALAERLEHTLGRRVRIEQGKSSGTVSLAFYGDDDLERLVAALETLSGETGGKRMEEKNNAPQPCGEKQPESKKFLVFYVIGLFCVALALILLSYIAQVRSDRRLNELTNQLSTQTSAAEGANARVQVLQQSVEEQTKVLSQLMQQTGTENTDELLAAVEKLSDQKKVLYEMTMAQQELSQNKNAEAKERIDGLVTNYTLERLNGTAQDALLTEESAALFTALYQQTRVVPSEETAE